MRDDCFNHKMIVATSTYVNEGCAALRLPDSEDLCAANWTGTLGGWAPVLKSNCLRVTDRPFSPALEAIRLHHSSSFKSRPRYHIYMGQVICQASGHSSVTGA